MNQSVTITKHFSFKHIYWAVIILIIVTAWFAGIQTLEASSLKVSPLKYEETVKTGEIKIGAIDISNPSDSTQKYNLVVRSFRQVNESGDLEFYDDPAVKKGIILDQPTITLNTRQAARVFFAIDSKALPSGGIYAAILVSDEPNQPATVSRTASAVQSGTLLILRNGESLQDQGEVVGINTGFWQFGPRMVTEVVYKNINTGNNAPAFYPRVLTRMFPWGGGEQATGPIIFAGNQRKFTIALKGSYLGFYPLTVADAGSGVGKTKWVFAVTGIWRFLLPVLIFASIGAGLGYFVYKLRKNQEIY